MAVPADGEIMTGAQLLRALEERKKKAPLRTGAPLDRLEGGGLRRGSLIELSGPRSSGRFAAALSALAAAPKGGESAALVDLGDQLDPAEAARAGVVLERLLWARPRRLKEALACALAAVGAGFSLVVLDLGETREPAPAASWLRLAREARAAQSILLLVSSRPTAGAAAEALLEAGASRADWDRRGPALLRGLVASWTLRRGRGERPALPHAPY